MSNMTETVTATMVAFADLANRDDETGLPLFWSNELGWVSEADATLFTESEAQILPLPLGMEVAALNVRVEFPVARR